MFTIQIHDGKKWLEYWPAGDTRAEVIEEMAKEIKLSPYAPLIRPAAYKEWNSESWRYLNGGDFIHGSHRIQNAFTA